MKCIKKIITLVLVFVTTQTHSSEKHFLGNKKIVSHIPFSQKSNTDFMSTAIQSSMIIVDEKNIAARIKRTHDMDELCLYYRALRDTKKSGYPTYEVDSAYLINQIRKKTREITAVLKQV